MKCILNLPCPVVAGECDRDGECYIWRCEHPHAPKPELAAPQAPAVTGNASPSPLPRGQKQPAEAASSDDDMLARFAELVLTVNAARFES